MLLAINSVSFPFFAEICCNFIYTEKPKSLVNIVENLNCLVESLLDRKIARDLNQVLVKYLINKGLYYNYVTGLQA